MQRLCKTGSPISTCCSENSWIFLCLPISGILSLWRSKDRREIRNHNLHHYKYVLYIKEKKKLYMIHHEFWCQAIPSPLQFPAGPDRENKTSRIVVGSSDDSIYSEAPVASSFDMVFSARW